MTTNQMPSTPILISHIPKTAGTSLLRIVERFHPDVMQAYQGELTLRTPDHEFLRRFRDRAPPSVVIGHFSFGVHEFLGVPPRYASVFRDPVQRVISLYWYQKSLPNSPFVREFNAGMTLAEFVESRITPMTNNQMCRVVAGVPPDRGVLVESRTVLERAIHNLTHYYEVIGIVEDYENAIRAFANVLGWRGYEIPLENVTPLRKETPNEAALDVIREHNRLDIELYGIIKSLCERRS